MKTQEGFDLTKAMSFLLVFVAMALIIGVGFIVPTVRTINKQNVLLEVESRSHKGIKERFDDENSKISNLKKDNEASLASLTKTFNSVAFEKIVQQKYGDVKLQKIGSSKDGEYIFDTYGVTISFNTPKDMFDFFDSVENSGSLIKIITPFTIASTGNKSIVASFYLRAISTELNTKKPVNATPNEHGK